MNSLYYTFKLVELTERENNICISKITGQIARSFGFKIKIYRIDTLKKFLKNKILELENDIRDSKTKEFIKNARIIHGFRYNYSQVKYINSTTDVIIICAKHGEFPQRPGNHIKKKPCNCPKCSGKYKPTTEEFISKCKKKYPNKFDYVKNMAHLKLKHVIIYEDQGVLYVKIKQKVNYITFYYRNI